MARLGTSNISLEYTLSLWASLLLSLLHCGEQLTRNMTGEKWLSLKWDTRWSQESPAHSKWKHLVLTAAAAEGNVDGTITASDCTLLMATLAFAVPAGNLFSWLLESWKVPRDIRRMMHALALSHHHLLWGGSLLKAVAASSCGTAPAGSIWWLTGWHLVGTASVGLSHGSARSWGTAGNEVHRSLLFPCCSANSAVLQTLGTFAVTNSKTSLPNSSLETLAEEVRAIGNEFQFLREISSSWIPIQFTYIQDILANIFADVMFGQFKIQGNAQSRKQLLKPCYFDYWNLKVPRSQSSWRNVWLNLTSPKASFKMFFIFPDIPLLIAGLVLSCQICVSQTFHAKSAFISLTKEKCNSAGINF